MPTARPSTNALKAAYGFDQDGLDNEWRAAHGLSARATAEPTQEQQQGSSGSQSQPQTDNGGGGTSTFVLIALAAGLVVLAGAVGLAGWAVARRL